MAALAAAAASQVRAVAALAAGVVFGVGLAVSQATDPRKVTNFLDFAGSWDPSLAFVLGGAFGFSALAFRFVMRRPAPLFDDRFHLSPKRAVDRGLLLGAALFGVGWGLSGYCPGPAIASIGLLNPEALWMVPAMFVGAALQRRGSSTR